LLAPREVFLQVGSQVAAFFVGFDTDLGAAFLPSPFALNLIVKALRAAR